MKSGLPFQLSPKLNVVLLDAKRLYRKTQPTKNLTTGPAVFPPAPKLPTPCQNWENC